jgi:polyhydroxyalkanoate synthesis regulator phasin
MWVLPKGSMPTKEDYEALLARIQELERKIAQLQLKRGRPHSEDKNG